MENQEEKSKEEQTAEILNFLGISEEIFDLHVRQATHMRIDSENAMQFIESMEKAGFNSREVALYCIGIK